MKTFRSARGASNFVTFLVVLGGAAAIYLGIVYVPVFMDDFDVKQTMREAGSLAYRDQNDARVQDFLMKQMAKIHRVPQVNRFGQVEKLSIIDPSTITVEMKRLPNQYMEIWLSYVRPVDWPLLRRRTYIRFNKYVKADLTPVDWGKSDDE